jgi:hypothetical protein
MTPNRKQNRTRAMHRLGQFYLGRWADEGGGVRVLFRHDGRETITGTKAVAVGTDFYAIRQPDGTISSEVEDVLKTWDGRVWRGQPLAGSDYPWAEGIIHQLHATLLDLLGRIGTARLQAGDPRGALQAAERAIALDSLHEPSWRLALQADHASASSAASPSTTTHLPTSSTNNSDSNPATKRELCTENYSGRHSRSG